MGSGVSAIMYALHGMTDCPETRKLLAALIPQLQSSWATLTPRQASSAVLGLQKLEDSQEARLIMANLAQKLRKVAGPLSGEDIPQLLLGLQTVGNSLEAQALVSATADLIEAAPSELSEKGVSDTIFALQSPFLGINASTPKLIKVLQPKFRAWQLYVDHEGVVWPIRGADPLIIGVEFGEHGAFWPDLEKWLKDGERKLGPTASRPQDIDDGNEKGKGGAQRKKRKGKGRSGPDDEIEED